MIESINKKPIIIFAGPSGVGKGTIEKYLFDNKELRLHLACSATTRKPRAGEVEGVHYFFISKEDFEKKINENAFLEYSYHFENYYGTLYAEIDRIHNLNKVPFLEIETNGAKQILSKKEVNDRYKVITFFILPPSVTELKNRILNRNTENKEAINIRMQKAIDEINDQHLFKYKIVNDDAELAAKRVTQIIKEEI
ncbi:guanylate kinase [Mycoplasmopsis agalactiae]|nr:guanylate kinase [Mycoplasmopsis agalactiae]MCE6056221.1 guanylate kinase [Mycoplasmopsis agalactiae]